MENSTDNLDIYKSKNRESAFEFIENHYTEIDSELLEKNYLCPITTQLFRIPVTAEDGKIQERAAIMNHFEVSMNKQNKILSPMTGENMGTKLLFERGLEFEINEYLKQKCGCTLSLFGGVGKGKSSTANKIFGRKKFKSEESFDPVTLKATGAEDITSDGRIIRIIDTPGLFAINDDINDMFEILLSAHKHVYGGQDAFCLVMNCRDRITEQDAILLEHLSAIFGMDMQGQLIIILTHADESKKNSNEIKNNFINTKFAKDIAEKMKNRIVVFNNENNENRDDVLKLYEYIEEIRKDNGKPFNREFMNVMSNIQNRMQDEFNKKNKTVEEILKKSQEDLVREFNKNYLRFRSAMITDGSIKYQTRQCNIQ